MLLSTKMERWLDDNELFEHCTYAMLPENKSVVQIVYEYELWYWSNSAVRQAKQQLCINKSYSEETVGLI